MRFVRLLFLLSSSLLLANTPEIDCNKHQIYCAITKLRPDIDRSFALTLSNYIYKASKKYNTDPLRTVAIMMQESSIRNIHRKQDVVLIRESCTEEGECTEYSQLATGYTDIGIFQFHARTIQAYNMDVLRLRDDLEYATDRHCYLLSVKISECSTLGKDAWSCYHSRTPKYRNKYIRMVDRYYRKLISRKALEQKESRDDKGQI